jgi:glycosyltransferase involved in cell wall biosynthesis
MPRVTVIIPTYNWSTVLPYSIASALEQTFADFELLVVGDGCTDDSERVVAAIEDPRVQWINMPERAGHQSAPNNEGLRRARGEYIAYLGHDDLWLPHHLALLVGALDAGADLAHSMLAHVNPDQRVVPGTFPPTSVAHRRSMIDVIGGWRDYREIVVVPEEDLWQRAAAAQMKFTFVRRLTAIKFGASVRRNVYRERPCHEQAAWLARIRSEPDLEMTELVKLVFELAPVGKKPTIAQRVLRFLRRPWLLPGAVWRRMTPRKGQIIRRIKRIKGA